MKDILYRNRLSTENSHDSIFDEIASDRSRIVFCSSFRRMMQKAQVFSLEKNTSVRNRLTHSLEVADIGKALARSVGKKLLLKRRASEEDVRCLEGIVENACLIHDMGNPPFGHFGEEAIKRWFTEKFKSSHSDHLEQTYFEFSEETFSGNFENDFIKFDGNPQGLRIITRLHNERGRHGLNLTASTILATIKYPKQKDKKLGVFSSESSLYKTICDETGHTHGKRYFAVYLMELADDICYCLSDIADAIEKGIVDSRMFKDEFHKVAKEKIEDWSTLQKELIPEKPIDNFSYQIAIPVTRKCIESGATLFSSKIDGFIKGEEKELIAQIKEGCLLECFKAFSRKFIYTSPEAQRLEIAGYRVVHGLLDHYGQLLKIDRAYFENFVKKEKPTNPKKNLDIEWRIFNQLSERMIKSYSQRENKSDEDKAEFYERCRLIVDYISGMTDQSALRFYQNAMGINLDY